MTLGQLSAFVLVARLGSVTGAARALGVSEPAVSQALAALRQHHGDRLLVRSAQGMTLTPATQDYLKVVWTAREWDDEGNLVKDETYPGSVEEAGTWPSRRP